jgi:N-acetylglutamate synthase-like GNAT family acetyltransferase
MIKILTYQTSYQSKIEQMLAEIALEFPEPITTSQVLPLSIPNPYWVAFNNNSVIGTIALIKINNYTILKKMMLLKAFRGKDFGLSLLLLNTAINWSKQNQIKQIYLGTMEQFKAAQSFYKKNGFIEILATELPKDFIHNSLDSVFYRLNLE